MQITFRCRMDHHDISGPVVNPGEWFGKVWLIQVGIANNLNPWVAVEADHEQSAIDVLANSEEYGHLINCCEDNWDDIMAYVDKHGGWDNITTAGNDNHPVDLDNVHMQPAPADLIYRLDWKPTDYDFTAEIPDLIDKVRKDRIPDWEPV